MACVLMELKLIGSFSLKRSLSDRRQSRCSKGKKTKINTSETKKNNGIKITRGFSV